MSELSDDERNLLRYDAETERRRESMLHRKGPPEVARVNVNHSSS